MSKILLFIPCYNCEKQITRVLAQLTPEVLQYLSRVLIVNNRSTDHTEERAAEYLKAHPSIPATLVRNDENYGLGGSHKVAFSYAMEGGYDHVIVLHGDDQGSIADLVPYLKDGSYEKYDSYLGSRFAKGSKLCNYSKFRIFGNHVFNVVVSAATGRHLTDLGSGLNLYRTDYLKSRFYMDFPDTLTFNVYMLLYGVYSKSDFAFFPLTWREEDQISNAKFFRQAREILSLVLRYVFRRKKLFAPQEGEERKYTCAVIHENA